MQTISAKWMVQPGGIQAGQYVGGLESGVDVNRRVQKQRRGGIASERSNKVAYAGQ